MERFKHQSGMTLGVAAGRPFGRFFTAWTGGIMMEKFRFWICFGGRGHTHTGRKPYEDGGSDWDAAAEAKLV